VVPIKGPTTIDCALEVGAIIYDDMGNKKRFFKNKFSIVPMKNSKNPRKIFNSPWDNDCSKIINKRKSNYKMFATHPRKIY